MAEQTQTPTLASVLRRAAESRLSDVHVCIPGKVERFDASENRADIKPLIKRGRQSETTGEREVESIPVVTEVPVIFPGSGGVRLRFPVSKGDTGLLLFSEASLDLWLQKGGEVDPRDDRRFSLSDGIFIPGLQSFKDSGDASPMIDITSSQIKLGASAVDGLLKGTSFLSALTTWQTALDTYIKIPTPTGGETTTYQAASTAFVAAVTAAISSVAFTE